MLVHNGDKMGLLKTILIVLLLLFVVIPIILIILYIVFMSMFLGSIDIFPLEALPMKAFNGITEAASNALAGVTL